jgi:hypothetical protein
MPLEEIRLTPKNTTRGQENLRDVKSLKTIGVEKCSTAHRTAATPESQR